MAEELKKVRGLKKSAVSRGIRTLSALITDEANPSELNEAITDLKNSYLEFNEAHDAVTGTLTLVPELEQNDKYADETHEKYLTVWRDAKILIAADAVKSKPPGEGDKSQPSQNDLTRQELSAILNLPKLTLEKFNGNPLGFHMFHTSFQCNVGSAAIDSGSKLARLLEYTCDEAYESIKWCALIGGDAGYNQAWKTLEARFGDPHVIAENIMRDVRSGKPVRTPKEFRQFSDNLGHSFEVMRKLEKLSELNTQSAIKDILSRLQTHVQTKWKARALEKKRNEGTYPDLCVFVSFVAEVAMELNDPVYGEVSKTEQNSLGPRSFYTTAGPTERQGETKKTGPECAGPTERQGERKKTSPACVLCGGEHYITTCDLFMRKSPPDRQRVAEINRLCFNCLHAGHVVEDCMRSSFCRVSSCREKHSKFLHRDPVINHAASSNDRVKNDSRVYMPIVPVVVNHEYVTYALLDTASSNSFCSKNLSSKLGLGGSRVSYELYTLGLGGKTEKTRAVDLEVEGKYTNGDLSMSNVYVVDEIPSLRPPPQHKSILSSARPYLTSWRRPSRSPHWPGQRGSSHSTRREKG